MPHRLFMLNSGSRWMGEVGHTFRLAQELAARGHDLLLFARPDSALYRRATQHGIKTETLMLRSGFHPVRRWTDYLKLRRLNDTLQPALIHCHRSAEHWFAATSRPWMTHKPAIVRTRHVAHRFPRDPLNRWLLVRGTETHIAVSRAAATMMRLPASWGGAVQPRVIYGGVDLAQFHPGKRSATLRAELGVAPEELLVGQIARFQNVKGQEVFFRAAARLKDRFSAARFLVCGNEGFSKIDAYRRQIRELGLDGRMDILKTADDIGKLIASLDIGVVASLGSEGSSRVAMEYQACGVPVVATRVGSLPEMIEPGATGLLADPGDAPDLAARLETLMTDASMRAAMARAGVERARAMFGIERWIDETLRAYDDAIATRQRQLS